MTSTLDRALNVLLTAAAICIAGVLLYRQVRPPTPVSLGQEVLQATAFGEWDDAKALGRLIGREDASLQLVVLSDMECPGCRAFHVLTRNLQRDDSLSLAVRLIPFSLPQHRFAAPAARLLECARDAGHFDAMLNALFAGQDSLGLKDWASFADEAGWHDRTQAESCAKSSAPVRYLDDSKAFGERIGLRATPTVVVNGFRLNRVPTQAELVEARDRVRVGRPPFEAAQIR